MLNEKKDTTICFSLNQGKYLLKQVYKVKECDTLRLICESQRLASDSIILKQKENITDYKSIIVKTEKEVWLKDNQVKGLQLDLNNQFKATKRQKTYKWCAIIGGGILSGYLGYKYVTKH